MSWYVVIPMIVAPIIGVIGTIFGGLLTYRANRRTAAGTVETSNASELWAENSRLIERLSKEVERLGQQVDTLEAVNLQLSAENRALHEQVKLLTAEVADLRTKVQQ